jgi:proline iminopeptidase
MLRDKELKWFYQDGASRIFPEAWEGFLKPIEAEDRHDLMDAYYKIFTGSDEKKKMEAAVAWSILEDENQLICIESIDKIRNIPTKIIQGRYDIVCPMETAWELSRNWPEAELIVAPSSGHSAFEAEITHELIKANLEFARNE